MLFFLSKFKLPNNVKKDITQGGSSIYKYRHNFIINLTLDFNHSWMMIYLSSSQYKIDFGYITSHIIYYRCFLNMI